MAPTDHTQQHPERDAEAPEWVNSEDAAAILGVTASTVRRRIALGELPAEGFEGNWILPRDAILAIAAQAVETRVDETPGHEAAVVEVILRCRLPDLPVLLTPKEAALVLRVNEAVVYDMLKRGELPSKKVGSARRIPTPGLVLWLASQDAA